MVADAAVGAACRESQPLGAAGRSAGRPRWRAPSPVYLFRFKGVLTASKAIMSANKRYPTGKELDRTGWVRRSSSFARSVVPVGFGSGLAQPGAGGRLILGVLRAGAADAANGRQALLEGGEATISATTHAAATVLRAPWIVLRSRRRARHDCGGKKSQRDQRNSHGRLPNVLRAIRSPLLNSEMSFLFHAASRER